MALFLTGGAGRDGAGMTLNDLANRPAGSTYTMSSNGLNWTMVPPDVPRIYLPGNGAINLHREGDGILSSTGDWTFLFRAQPQATLTDGAWFSQYVAAAGNGRLSLDVDGTQWRLFLGNDAALGSVSVTGGANVVAGTEYIVAATRHYRTFRLYVDGTEVDNNTDGGTRTILQHGNILGGLTTLDTVSAGSRLSYFLVWHRTLSPGEIARLSIDPYQLIRPRSKIFAALWSGAAPAPPDAPTNLAASTVSSVRIDLTWTDNAGDETGFKIERSPDNADWTQIDTVLADIEAYSSVGLDPNTLYYYRVRAYNAGGNSAYTNVASAKTATDSEFQYLPIVLRTTGQQAQSDGRYVSLVDGAPEPDTVAGWALLYIDEADGDFKIKFGDGTVAVVAADT